MNYPHALEKYNRETHSDALREMQIAPAKTIQPIDHPMTGAFPLRWAVPLAVMLGFALVWAVP